MSRIKELNLKRIALYALGILLCYAGIKYMDTWLTKVNQELNDGFNTIDWFCETRIRVLKGNYLLVDTKRRELLPSEPLRYVQLIIKFMLWVRVNMSYMIWKQEEKRYL